MKKEHEQKLIAVGILVALLLFVAVFLGHKAYVSVQTHNAQAAALQASQAATAAKEAQSEAITKAFSDGEAKGKAEQAAADKTTVKPTTPVTTVKPAE